MKRIPRVIAVLHLSTVIAVLIQQGKGMVQAMSAPNPWFAALSNLLAAVGADLDALAAAEVLARTKALGAVAARDEKHVVVVKSLNRLRDGIQQVADENPGLEAEIITSATASVRRKGARAQSVFRVEQGRISGQLDIFAPFAGRSASHYWQMSGDQKVWTSLPETTRGAISVSSLTPGATYSFRHRVLTPKGLSDWGQVVSIMVR